MRHTLGNALVAAVAAPGECSTAGVGLGLAVVLLLLMAVLAIVVPVQLHHSPSKPVPIVIASPSIALSPSVYRRRVVHCEDVEDKELRQLAVATVH
jgi:carbon starvation protein CstA